MEKLQTSKPLLFYPPGGILIWIIILVELVTFGGIFVFYFIERSSQLELFKSSQNFLNRDLATLNTLILILSGFFAANAVHSHKMHSRIKCIRNFSFASCFGLFFVGLKCFEYYEKISLGKTLGTNIFFDFYWMLTGFHLVHVILGIILMLSISWQIFRFNENEETATNIETVASFWHLCDLIWVFLFPVIYLI